MPRTTKLYRCTCALKSKNPRQMTLPLFQLTTQSDLSRRPTCAAKPSSQPLSTRNTHVAPLYTSRGDVALPDDDPTL
eukprot:6929917-Pyramimonas_sp.AAC.1